MRGLLLLFEVKRPTVDLEDVRRVGLAWQLAWQLAALREAPLMLILLGRYELMLMLILRLR